MPPGGVRTFGSTRSRWVGSRDSDPVRASSSSARARKPVARRRASGRARRRHRRRSRRWRRAGPAAPRRPASRGRRRRPPASPTPPRAAPPTRRPPAPAAGRRAPRPRRPSSRRRRRSSPFQLATARRPVATGRRRHREPVGVRAPEHAPDQREDVGRPLQGASVISRRSPRPTARRSSAGRRGCRPAAARRPSAGSSRPDPAEGTAGSGRGRPLRRGPPRLRERLVHRPAGTRPRGRVPGAPLRRPDPADVPFDHRGIDGRDRELRLRPHRLGGAEHAGGPPGVVQAGEDAANSSITLTVSSTSPRSTAGRATSRRSRRASSVAALVHQDAHQVDPVGGHAPRVAQLLVQGARLLEAGHRRGRPGAGPGRPVPDC